MLRQEKFERGETNRLQCVKYMYRLEACGVAGLIIAHMCRDTSQATMVQGIIKYGLIRIRIRIRMYREEFRVFLHVCTGRSRSRDLVPPCHVPYRRTTVRKNTAYVKEKRIDNATSHARHARTHSPARLSKAKAQPPQAKRLARYGELLSKGRC